MGDGLQRFIAVLAVKAHKWQQDFSIRNHDIFAEEPIVAALNITCHQEQLLRDLEVVSVGLFKVLTPEEFDVIYKHLPDTIDDLAKFDDLFTDINHEGKIPQV